MRSSATSSGWASPGTKGRCGKASARIATAQLRSGSASDRFGRITLLRPDGTATYHLASVVDDIEYEITHVVRGSDHRPNEQLHRELPEALGAKPPEYMHHGLVLGPDGGKLSKRDAMSSVADLRDAGIPAEAVRAYLEELGLPRHDVQLDLARIRRLAVDAIAAMPDEELAARVGVSPELVPAVRGARDPQRGARVRAADPRARAGAAAGGGAADARALQSELVDGDARETVRELKAAGGDLRALRLALTGRERGPELWTVIHALPPRGGFTEGRCGSMTADAGKGRAARPPGRSACTSAGRRSTSGSTSATRARSSSRCGFGAGCAARVRRDARREHHRHQRQDLRGRARRQRPARRRRVPLVRRGHRPARARPTGSRAEGEPRRCRRSSQFIERADRRRAIAYPRVATSTSASPASGLRRALRSHRHRASPAQPLRGAGAERAEGGPRDFALWKGTRRGRTPRGSRRGAGAGRAGTSSARRWPRSSSGPAFEIHGGGLDLVFPHHENEIAQSRGARAASSPRSGCTTGCSDSPARRCRSRSGTSSRSARRSRSGAARRCCSSS